MKELKGYICELCRYLVFGVCPVCKNKNGIKAYPYNPLSLESRNKSNRKVKK